MPDWKKWEEDWDSWIVFGAGVIAGISFMILVRLLYGP